MILPPAALWTEIAYAPHAMAEWVTLLLLVPAFVTPAVLLFGFSGCFLDSTGAPADPNNPPPDGEGDVSKVAILSAEGTSDSVITLTWEFDGMLPADHAEFERTKVSDPIPTNFDAAVSPHEDTGLEAATDYEYRARGISSVGDSSLWSDPVPAKTLAFLALDVTQDGSFGNVDTNTVK